MQWQDKRVLVIGMARSGEAAALALAKQGAVPVINDTKDAEGLQLDLTPFQSYSFVNALAQDPLTYLPEVDMIVVSPGVPPTAPVFSAAKEAGVPLIAEIELGYLLAQAPIVAIGGTNGKTTTTALTGEIFLADGRDTYVLGNIGIPLSGSAAEAPEDGVIVAEIASLQLETVDNFRPHSAVLLNITEDHLDRFGSMERYTQIKAKMFAKQDETDFAVLNADDPIVSALGQGLPGRVSHFSRTGSVAAGACVEDGWIVFRMDGDQQRICPVDSVRIPGAHNLENALAAVAVSMPTGVKAEAAAAALASFAGVEHRIESVCERDGVLYINDSKATNPASSIKAVEAMTRPTVLLLGGSNKNSDYTPLFRAFGGRIKAVVTYGETAGQILRDAKLTNYRDIHYCKEGFDGAVHLAAELAAPGGTVLLSPACASYDAFDNFEERGRRFKAIVREEL